MEECFSCGIKHPQVECTGIWYCPNALCMGSGGAWFRAKLKSYRDIDKSRHHVDEKEWLKEGRKYNEEHKINRKNFKRRLKECKNKMSGECDKCGNHTLECLCKKENVTKSHIDGYSYEEKLELCTKCNNEVYRVDKFCIKCEIEETKKMIREIDKKLENFKKTGEFFN